MELEFFIFLLSLAFLGYAVFLKFCYMKHKAVCLDYTRADGISLLVTYPLYEYILLENNKIVTHRRYGVTMFTPKKGKTYTVLIRKTDHTKVVGYSEFVFYLCLGIFFLISSILETLSWVL